MFKENNLCAFNFKSTQVGLLLLQPSFNADTGVHLGVMWFEKAINNENESLFFWNRSSYSQPIALYSVFVAAAVN